MLRRVVAGLSTALFLFTLLPVHADYLDKDLAAYKNARWNPIHFKPAIDQASNDQCLECHSEILEHKPRKKSPAGVYSEKSVAWYQTLSDYEGEQDSFHRRHFTSSAAKRLMNFKCSDCHQGNNPGTEVAAPDDTSFKDTNTRKKVDTEICLMCHGKFDYQVMAGLQGDWPAIRDAFDNNCVTCHLTERTKRHLLTFLNTEAIETAGVENSDSCYGCHGGRSWYAIPYPYVRRDWLERMPSVAPAWVEGRPQAYPARFTDPVKEAAMPKEIEEPKPAPLPDEEDAESDVSDTEESTNSNNLNKTKNTTTPEQH